MTTAFEQHLSLSPQQQAVLNTITVTTSDLNAGLLGYLYRSADGDCCRSCSMTTPGLG